MYLVEDRNVPVDREMLAQCDFVARLEDEDGLVGYVGVQTTHLIGRVGFVWFEPGPAMRASKARTLLRMWKERKGEWSYLSAGVAQDSVVAQRFAEFFGMLRMGKLIEGFYVYGIDNDSTGGNSGLAGS